MPQPHDATAELAVHCGTTVEVHGRLAPHPWLVEVVDEGFRAHVLDLAAARSDAYGWQGRSSVYGWRTPRGRELFPVPERWFVCDAGGEWTPDEETRQLAWLRADLPEEMRQPRLPILPMARTLVDALTRVGSVTYTTVRTYLPLQLTAGEAESDLEDMRDWFSLADPSASVDVSVTVSAAPSSAWDSPGEAARLRGAVQERLGEAATVDGTLGEDPADDAARQRSGVLVEGAGPRVRLACRSREWSPDVAVWLIEATGDALRATGHTTPVVVSASRAE